MTVIMAPLTEVERYLIAAAKTLVAIAGAGTAGAAILMAGWQFELWLKLGRTDFVSIAEIFDFLGPNGEASYTTASMTTDATPVADGIFARFLEIPALIPLLAVLALLALFRKYVSHVEAELQG